MRWGFGTIIAGVAIIYLGLRTHWYRQEAMLILGGMFIGWGLFGVALMILKKVRRPVGK